MEEDDEFRYFFGGHIRFKKNPKDDEMLIDWCPVCGEKLADLKIETRANHDKKFHPDYVTLQSGINREDLFDKEKLK